MKTYSIIFLILSVSIFGCDKKIKEYSDIKVEDNNGETLALTTLEGEWIVYAFLSPECPLSENYTRTLMQFQDSLLDEDVLFYYVFPGIFYPKQQIQVFAENYGMPLDRFLYDKEYLLRDYCAASTTPEVFLIDKNGKIFYSGAIDNWAITLGKQRQVISEHYLGDAINEVLQGKEVSVSKTRAVGCIIE
jgi:thioredoxin-related protein